MNVCEVLEDLLESCLTHRVLTDVVLAFHGLDEAEDRADRFVQSGDADAHVVTVLFDHFHFSEGSAELEDTPEKVNFSVRLANLVILVLNLTKSSSHILLNLGVELIEIKLTFWHQSLLNSRKFRFVQRLGLNFNHITGTELVLDVLGAAVTLENTAFD